MLYLGGLCVFIEYAIHLLRNETNFQGFSADLEKAYCY